MQKAKAAPKKTTAAPKAKAVPKTAQTTIKTTKAPSKKKAKVESDEENSDVDGVTLDDDSLLLDTPPASRKQKKAPASKKAAGKPLREMENESAANDIMDSPKPKKGSNTDKYQKASAAHNY